VTPVVDIEEVVEFARHALGPEEVEKQNASLTDSRKSSLLWTTKCGVAHLPTYRSGFQCGYAAPAEGCAPIAVNVWGADGRCVVIAISGLPPSVLARAAAAGFGSSTPVSAPWQDTTYLDLQHCRSDPTRKLRGFMSRSRTRG